MMDTKEKFKRYLELMEKRDNETSEEQTERKMLFTELIKAAPHKTDEEYKKEELFKRNLKLKKKKRK